MVIEVTCCQPGNWDGCWMGYALRFNGTWDAWVASAHDHRTLRKVRWNVSKDDAIKAIAENWTY